ncbi:MAG TPA: sulfate adenylyltransferase, partial [Verrucomicrobiales bacterium]|nr:sulfate adenylyltransferase [Verrucomicrobiales bacterium]
EGPKEETVPQLSYSITVADEIDTSRGGMIVKASEPAQTTHEFDAMICWFADKKILKPRGRFHLRHTTNEVKAVVTEVRYKININTLHKIEDDLEFRLNDIGRISLRTSAPLMYDGYRRNRTTGSFILIDEQTNETVAAGMIL